MKISFSKLTLLAAIAAPSYSVLATPTVTFEGEVTSQTCSVDINGQTNSVVLLPTVAIADFGSTLAEGQTAGQTPFTVSITGCQAVSSDTKVTTKFLGYIMLLAHQGF